MVGHYLSTYLFPLSSRQIVNHPLCFPHIIWTFADPSFNCFSFNIQPPINRGEVRDLWTTFLTNKDGKLEWNQFIRTFGHSMKSAAYPNAKVNPPKRGDADFSKKSKILNSDMDLLQDSLRSKVCPSSKDLASSNIPKTSTYYTTYMIYMMYIVYPMYNQRYKLSIPCICTD